MPSPSRDVVVRLSSHTSQLRRNRLVDFLVRSYSVDVRLRYTHLEISLDVVDGGEAAIRFIIRIWLLHWIRLLSLSVAALPSVIHNVHIVVHHSGPDYQEAIRLLGESPNAHIAKITPMSDRLSDILSCYQRYLQGYRHWW